MRWHNNFNRRLQGADRYFFAGSRTARIGVIMLAVVTHAYNPSAGRLRKEHYQFKTNLGHTGIPVLKTDMDAMKNSIKESIRN